MFVIEVETRLGLVFADELHAVIIDEDVCGASLHLVCGDGGLDRFDGGFNDSCQTFLVNRHLDRDVRERGVKVSIQPLRRLAGIVLCIYVDLIYWTEHLHEITH